VHPVTLDIIFSSAGDKELLQSKHETTESVCSYCSSA